VALPGRVRPLLFDRPLDAKPGETATVSVDILSEQPRPYRLACSYLVASPRSSPSAPYKLTQRIMPSVDMESKAEIRVRVVPIGGATDSQVVARIGLPGGCAVDVEAMNCLVGRSSLSSWSVDGGYLDLYWERGPGEGVDLTIPVRAEIAGRFVARPSFIYPYYEAGREWYAEPLAIKVLNTFGSTAKVEDLLGRPGSGPAIGPRRGGPPCRSGGRPG